MILIFGGTTEGRVCVNVCEEAHQPFFYSTKGDYQEVPLVFGKKITGALDVTEIVSFCVDKRIKLIINAAHPFAENLHNNIALASDKLQIPVIRYEREYPERDSSLIWTDSYQDTILFLKENNIDRLLALSGVNTIEKLKSYWKNSITWFRILKRPESIAIALQQGFPVDNLIYYSPKSDNIAEVIKELGPQAIFTKESGESGGFEKKVSISRQFKIPLIVIKRPVLSPNFILVFGPYGLRKQIEALVPDYFPLKIGYTTGTCATAAAKAAFIGLLSGKAEDKVAITLPSGEQVFIEVNQVNFSLESATAVVVKDAGDDPDVTHQKEIVAEVKLNTSHKGVRFLQGEGVGVVTLPGLGLEIGGPAINKTPRMMMKREVFKVMSHYIDKLPNGFKTGVDITISVPEGKLLALKTFNPKLGIEGGISIIGTSGIVKPFSTEAFIASIRREMQVTNALGCKHIVINSGAKSERYLKKKYPYLRSNAFVHYGNFIGEAIGIAQELGFDKLTMGIMLGKAVKLATGALDTHSKKINMDKSFLISIAKEAECDEQTLSYIEKITLARELWTILGIHHSFFQLVLSKCYKVCRPLFRGNLEIVLITDEGDIITRK